MFSDVFNLLSANTFTYDKAEILLLGIGSMNDPLIYMNSTRQNSGRSHSNE